MFHQNIVRIIGGIWLSLSLAPYTVSLGASTPSEQAYTPALQAGFCGDKICDAYMNETALTCPADCTQSLNMQGFCGDRICDAYAGETNLTCTADCGQPGTVSGQQSPNATSTPTASATPTEEHPTVTSEPTDELVRVALIAPPAGCSLIPFSTSSKAWQKSYLGFAANDEQSASMVYTCSQQITGHLCFPHFGSSENTSEDFLVLVGCNDAGTCVPFKGAATKDSSGVCFEIPAQSAFDCLSGCAVSNKPLTQLAVSGLNLPNLSCVILPIGLALLTLFFGGLLVIAGRNRKREKEN